MTTTDWEQKYAELQFVYERLQNKHDMLQKTHNELKANYDDLQTMYMTERLRQVRPDDPNDYWRIKMDGMMRRIKIVELQLEILMRKEAQRQISHFNQSHANNNATRPSSANNKAAQPSSAEKLYNSLESIEDILNAAGPEAIPNIMQAFQAYAELRQDLNADKTNPDQNHPKEI